MGLLTGPRRRARDRRRPRPQPAPLPGRGEADRDRVQPRDARHRAHGRRRRRPLDRPARRDAQALEFPDESFDTVVCTLALCTIPNDRDAVAEANRVLRPGGRFLLLEHVRSPNPAIRLAQRRLDPLTVRFEGDHLLREPLDHLHAEGFEIQQLIRSKLGIVERIAALTPRDRRHR